MSYLIDTCALSELARPGPDENVTRWFDETPQRGLYLSVLTLGEIRKGIETLGDTHRRNRIQAWLEFDLPDWFEDRILPVDAGVADEWGCLLARAGRRLPAIDSLIAATARYYRLTVVTRNTADFADTGTEIINPWQA
jgi:hypothetical protein